MVGHFTCFILLLTGLDPVQAPVMTAESGTSLKCQQPLVRPDPAESDPAEDPMGSRDPHGMF